MQRGVMVCAVALVVLYSGISGAAEETAKEPRIKTLETVVVTATKTEEKTKDVANPVIVKDSFDIEESPANSLGELLANEPGVDWRTRGNYGGAAQEINMRGMGGDEVLVMMNGVSVNSPSLGRADVGAIPMNAIDRVEVVKGSGSLLYGSGAMAGVVNIITKRPERDRMALKASAGYGTQNTYRLAAEQGMFVLGDFGYYLTAGRQETDGHRNNGDLTHNDVSLKLVFDKGDILDVSLYGDYINREFGKPGIDPPPESNPPQYWVNGVKFYDTESASLVDRGETDDGHLVLDVQSKPLDWLRVRAKGYYTDMESYDFMRYNADGYMRAAGEGNKTWVNNTIVGAEGNVEFTPIVGGSLLLGADIREHDWKTKVVALDEFGADTPGESTNKADIETKGFFAEAQYRPFKYAKFIAGIRQENHSTFGTENLPLFGLVVNPFESTVLKLTHGKHFKAPTPNDLFWPEDDFVSGNPDLKPQTGWHTNVTLGQEAFQSRLRLVLSYFNWNIDDKIDWAENPNVPGPYGDKWTPTNMNKSCGNGWEAEVRYDPVYAFGFSLGYTHTNAEDETPTVTRAAQYVPDHLAKADVVYRSTFGLTATATGRYVSDRPFFKSTADVVPTQTLPAYATLDMKVDQRLLTNWVISLQANNLLDEEYDTYSGSFVDGTGNRLYGTYPGSGQSVFASVTYQY